MDAPSFVAILSVMKASIQCQIVLHACNLRVGAVRTCIEKDAATGEQLVVNLVDLDLGTRCLARVGEDVVGHPVEVLVVVPEQ